MIKRSSGILMHITSLPSPYGIGTFGKKAYEFVDFLEDSGQKYWQILPLGPTGYGDSPYQSFSAFAGNPYFIDFDLLAEDGLLNRDDYINVDFGSDPTVVDYEKIFNKKLPILKLAFKKGWEKYTDDIQVFRLENNDWLEDYALYMAVKSKFDLRSWHEWDEDIKLREPKALDRYSNDLKDEVNYWIFLQFLFYKQWMELKEYANGKNIGIIGDIPIYVAEDSADVWANSKIFLLNNDNKPIKVAGCPPDAFSATGQLWGNPLYKWDVLEENGFDWWIKRIESSFKLYDVVRIDHFRGFESYWSIPYGDETAEHGQWIKGPAIKLFNAVKEKLGDLNIIAEDLGFLTKEVIDFLKETGYPGMKVLQFAFDTREESDYLPHNYNENSIAYTGTHDNDTVNGWFENANPNDVNHAIKYLKLNHGEGYNWGFIRGVWSSVAKLSVAQMQDFLGLSNEARMNIPSTLGGNWQWRAKDNDINKDLADRIKDMTKLYGR